MVTETVVVMTEEQLQDAMTVAVGAKDWKKVKELSATLTKMDADKQKSLKEELQKKLETTGAYVKGFMSRIVTFLTAGNTPTNDEIKLFSADLRKITGKELDGAEGVWYAKDFGDTTDGIKLMKSKSASTGGGSSKSSYVSNPAKSEDLLKEHGDKAMFDKETEVTINKEVKVMPAGMTLKEAYDFSTNGGWRNRVRMALLKAAGLV